MWNLPAVFEWNCSAVFSTPDFQQTNEQVSAYMLLSSPSVIDHLFNKHSRVPPKAHPKLYSLFDFSIIKNYNT